MRGSFDHHYQSLLDQQDGHLITNHKLSTVDETHPFIFNRDKTKGYLIQNNYAKLFYELIEYDVILDKWNVIDCTGAKPEATLHTIQGAVIRRKGDNQYLVTYGHLNSTMNVELKELDLAARQWRVVEFNQRKNAAKVGSDSRFTQMDLQPSATLLQYVTLFDNQNRLFALCAFHQSAYSFNFELQHWESVKMTGDIPFLGGSVMVCNTPDDKFLIVSCKVYTLMEFFCLRFDTMHWLLVEFADSSLLKPMIFGTMIIDDADGLNERQLTIITPMDLGGIQYLNIKVPLNHKLTDNLLKNKTFTDILIVTTKH